MGEQGKLLETSTDYDQPFRRGPVWALNGLGRRMPRELASLDEDSLVAAARRKAGLEDFGDEWFLTPLRELLRSIEAEAELNTLGRVIQRARFVSALVNRLRAQQLFVEHPEILAAELGPMVVIAGLQRTGTTMLHRLLAADPRARALLSWEALNPAPFPGEGPGAEARQREAKRAQRALAYLAPEFFAVHPIEFDAPEEDVLLLDLAFMSQAPEATMHVPSYARWLEAQDHAPAYRDLGRMLRLLQWQRGGEHWVLKTPHHMEHLDVLLAQFPQAKIIQTHRDPRKTMASFCSMVAHGRGVFSDRVDAREVAAHWLRKVGRMVERSMSVRDELGPEAFFDVAYADLIADPMGQVEAIYAFLAMSLPPQTREAIEAARGKTVRNRHGRHVYRLADFGLEEATLDVHFAAYRRRHSIRQEAGASDALPRGSAPHLGHQNILSATVTGVLDLFSTEGRLPGLEAHERLDGKTCLITGASRGLGLAVAQQMAERGARVIMACRSRVPEAGQDIRQATGSEDVSMMQVDLADLRSVHRLCDQLRDEGVVIDVAVLNAGLMPRRARRSPQGLEEMFAVHFLANRVLMARWVEDGVIEARPESRSQGRGTPRVILVSSEAHRSAAPIDFERFGEFVDFGLRGGMAQYSSTKLHMSTLACELSRRLNRDGRQVCVHALCPGPVDSAITREAPAALKPLLGAVTTAFFRAPKDAAEPVLYLACAHALEAKTGSYLHMMRSKQASEWATDPGNGARLWEASAALLATLESDMREESPELE